MARRNVITGAYFKYKRKAPKSPFLGWGYTAVRKESTDATSPRLLGYRSCIAGALSGKTGTLKDIQEAFKTTAPRCAAEKRSLPTVLKR